MWVSASKAKNFSYTKKDIFYCIKFDCMFKRMRVFV